MFRHPNWFVNFLKTKVHLFFHSFICSADIYWVSSIDGALSLMLGLGSHYTWTTSTHREHTQ